jgi:hypothetical protein
MKYKKYIYDILYEKIDPWTAQCPHKTKDQIFETMLSDMDKNLAFPAEKDGMIFYIMPETPWLARLHLYSATKTVKQTISAGKYLTSFMFDSIKTLEKIYGITPHQKFVRVAHKFGWRQEGVLSRSYLTRDEKLVDQYMFGITRPEYANIYSKSNKAQNTI